MDVPEFQLVDRDAVSGLPQGVGKMHGQALAIKRFDRTPEGVVHIEDFAQIFGVFPDHKYDKGNYRMIGRVLGSKPARPTWRNSSGVQSSARLSAMATCTERLRTEVP